MAKVDLELLRKNIESKIKKDADKFRSYYVNKQTLVISHDNKSIEAQALIQMALREGYKTKADFKKGLDDRFPGEGVFGKIQKTLADAVPKFNENIYNAVLAEKNKSTTAFVIEFYKGHNATKYTFEFSRKKEGKGLFQTYKSMFKSNAQIGMIAAINAWSMTPSKAGPTYSRRGQEFGDAKLQSSIGAKVPVKSGGHREQRRTITKKGEEYTDQAGQVQKSNSMDSFLDLGHMEGSSVSGARLLQAKEAFTEFKGTDQQKKVAEALLLKLSVITDYKGEGQKKFAVEWEAASLNRQTSSEAKKEVTFLNNRLQEMVAELHKEMGGWENAESSDSFLQMIEKKTIAALIKPVKGNKRVKTKTRLKTGAQKNSKSSVGKNNKTKPRRTRIVPPWTAPTLAKVIKSTRTGKSRSAPANAPLFLLGVLNEQLPQRVESNMGAPALTNITGRFASSPRVTDMAITPQGFPSIGYTYQRDPYGVFEQDPDYDPRKLIDRSIREIASQYAIGRFYTRRV